jgi:hypothetical protein
VGGLVNACFDVVDAHDHSTGKGVQITPTGLNINQDLSIGGNNLTTIRSVRLGDESADPSGMAAAQDLRIVYSSGGELFYRDALGRAVQLTSAGSVAGATGTISGLGSNGTTSLVTGTGTTGTFVVYAAASKPAKFVSADIALYEYNNAAANPVLLKAPTGLASAYTITMPATPPVTVTSALMMSTSACSVSQAQGFVPVGAVLATFPHLTGAYSTTATTAADNYGYVLCQGQTIADAGSPMNGQAVPDLHNNIFLRGAATSGTLGGAATIFGGGGPYPHVHELDECRGDGHTHNMAHAHQWSWYAPGQFYSQQAASGSQGTFTTTGTNTNGYLYRVSTDAAPGSTSSAFNGATLNAWYTSGALTNGGSVITNTGTESVDTTVSGTTNTNNTSGGASIAIIPPYITAVFLMRIK